MYYNSYCIPYSQTIPMATVDTYHQAHYNQQRQYSMNHINTTTATTAASSGTNVSYSIMMDHRATPPYHPVSPHRHPEQRQHDNCHQQHGIAPQPFFEQYKLEIKQFGKIESKWTGIRPYDWSPSEVLEWLFDTLEQQGVDCKSFPAEVYQKVTGAQLSSMDRIQNLQMDPLYGGYVHDNFNAVLGLFPLNNQNTSSPGASTNSMSPSMSKGSPAANSPTANIPANNDKEHVTYTDLTEVKYPTSNNHQNLDLGSVRGAAATALQMNADCMIMTSNQQPNMNQSYVPGDYGHYSYSTQSISARSDSYDSTGSDSGQGTACSTSSDSGSPTYTEMMFPLPTTDAYNNHHYYNQTPPTSTSSATTYNGYNIPHNHTMHQAELPPHHHHHTNLGYQNKHHEIQIAGGKRTHRSGSKGSHLWEFIRDLLHDDRYNPKVIRWEDAEAGVFRFVVSEAVAKLWGQKKKNTSMTYEKLSRAMRFCRQAGFFGRLPKSGKYPKKLCFVFGPKATGWKRQ